MKRTKFERRKFLTALTATAAGGAFLNTISPHSGIARSNFFENNTEFLLSPGLIYLNTGTLGPCRRETIEASQKAWEDLESLPIKFYGGWGAEELKEKTRTTAASFLGCDLSEIMVTPSTTNGMNSIAQGLRLKAGDHIILTDQEHGGGALCWSYLAKYHGVIIDTIIIPPGENSAEQILNRINDTITQNTKLISISHVFSSTGLRVPIDKVSALARSKGILCIVDGAQAAGAVKVNVKELGCHAYATSGHKWLMGPKGTGLLYISNDAQDTIRPMQFEESHNTYTDGNGVVNLACILGLNKAIEYLQSLGIDKIEEYNLSLRNHLYERLLAINNLKIMSPPPGPLASPMVAFLLPEPIKKAAFSKMLFEKYKISARPTHNQWFNGIRFSVHVFNTRKEVDLVAYAVQKELMK